MDADNKQLIAEIFQQSGKVFITYHVEITPELVNWMCDAWREAHMAELREYCERKKEKDG